MTTVDKLAILYVEKHCSHEMSPDELAKFFLETREIMRKAIKEESAPTYSFD